MRLYDKRLCHKRLIMLFIRTNMYVTTAFMSL